LSRRRIASVLGPIVVVTALTVVLDAAGADLAVAALCFVPLVVGFALLGSLAGAVSAIASFLVVNYFFTPPRHSLEISKTQDLAALVAFAVAAAVVSATVARVNTLRVRALEREREARTRLDVTTRLAAGEDPAVVVARAGEQIRDLFDLDECAMTLDADGRVRVTTRPPSASLPANDRSLFDAFVSALSSSLDRRRLEEEARVAHEQAATEQARAAFLATMTHNLRTPLASIGAAAALLLDEGVPPDRRIELAGTVRGEADRLDRLVTKVLVLGRIQAGSIRLDRSRYDVDELIEAAARRLQLVGRDRISLAPHDQLPSVLVDPALVEVALVNVLENALRYADDGSPVEIAVIARDGSVEVSVVDHGPGVPAAERDHVFEPFTRGVGATDPVGAGIGLAITREFVQAHGGTCRIGETPGGGATFVMTFPVG
jgi:two-component system sensor histidine kinase KdpD